MPDMLTPGEAAQALNVQPRTIRRMAEHYEGVFGELPRMRPDDGRSPRLWPVEALRRVQVAQLALKTGKVTSLEHALTLVRDGAELPVRAEQASGQPPDTLTADVLNELRALRSLAEAQGRELAALRSAMTEGRALPAPGPIGDELAELKALRTAAALASTMPPPIPAEMVAELAGAKNAVAVLMAEKQARNHHPLTVLLRLVGVRL